MSFGPAPARQAAWDWRAAGNFIGGGAGGGLVMASAFSSVQGTALSILMAVGGALVGAGLTCVWLEIGRPLRALHVFFNPRTSWMSREALAATVLMLALACVVFGVSALAPLAAICALVFVYCQARMIQAARGIAAWREPRIVPLIVLTALAEGGGLLVASGLVAGAWHVALAVLVLARFAAWLVYRRAIASAGAPLDAAGRVLLIAGTLQPIVLVPWAAPAAGLLATLAGSYFKFALVTRAGFNQGFALAHLPVRGVPRR
jgi:phenylacetyl-CoA:acceptor oxidoreductase subunit 2